MCRGAGERLRARVHYVARSERSTSRVSGVCGCDVPALSASTGAPSRPWATVTVPELTTPSYSHTPVMHSPSAYPSTDQRCRPHPPARSSPLSGPTPTHDWLMCTASEMRSGPPGDAGGPGCGCVWVWAPPRSLACVVQLARRLCTDRLPCWWRRPEGDASQPASRGAVPRTNRVRESYISRSIPCTAVLYPRLCGD